MARLLLRVEDAAQELGISRAQVYNLLARGELQSIALGKSRRIPREDLEAFVQQKRHEAAGERVGAA